MGNIFKVLIIVCMLLILTIGINAQTMLTPVNVSYDIPGVYWTATATLYGHSTSNTASYIIDVRGFDGYFEITVNSDTASVATTSTETDSLVVTVTRNVPLTQAEYNAAVVTPSLFTWGATAWVLNFDGQTASSKLLGIDWTAEQTYMAYIPGNNSIGKTDFFKIDIYNYTPDTTDVDLKVFGWRR